jgi:hypothetical protein
MTRKPAPKPVDPSELPRLARAVIAADRFPFLATVDGDRPRLRPVSGQLPRRRHHQQVHAVISHHFCLAELHEYQCFRAVRHRRPVSLFLQ